MSTVELKATQYLCHVLESYDDYFFTFNFEYKESTEIPNWIEMFTSLFLIISVIWMNSTPGVELRGR